MKRVMARQHINIDISIVWSINVKKSLQNINGFSLKLPSVMDDKLPTWTSKLTSKIIIGNPEVLYQARIAFMASEHPERFQRALTHKIRTTGELRF